MATGTVRTYHDEKDFGYITPDGGGPEVFVHHSVAAGRLELNPGDKVEYTTVEGAKGPQADSITVL
ncbi:cold-shock protein [Embleya sp. NPDC056575]|uniref:cold-shock protein n=1 Tax=unclassified Embleya TaxID=2699296 RepID=UPI003697FA9E